MMVVMGYRELLPDVNHVATEMDKAGLNKSQQSQVLRAFAYVMDEHAQYFDNEYERIGEKQDMGASEALSQFADDFRLVADETYFAKTPES